MKFNKIYEFKAGNDGILSILINNEILYACGEDNFIRSFNISNYRKISEANAHSKAENDYHQDEIYSIEIYDGKLITTSNDSYIRIWEINN